MTDGANITNNGMFDRIENSQDTEITGKLDKISKMEAEKIAYEAAVKAKVTVPGWKGEQIMRRGTSLITEIPDQLFSLDNYNKKQKPDIDEMYSVMFQDIGDKSSFLYVYLDAITGDVIGECGYKPVENENYSKPDSGLESLAKITAAKAEKIAFEAAKKAKNTIPYWQNAEPENIKCRSTELTNDNPTYVTALDDFENKLDLKGILKYNVWFQDVGDVSSFLCIYVDAVTGEPIGCKYISD
ncbi:hypothetical protein [Desulfitobacterium sp. PCE1]|uniref:hypothetical protein n=1 Tax=Desulfitobacterium sp. PCE1 TaxID=146907 RepID=UPI000381AEF1|nr:hypothetical protein [Desulfitobacterium sp. PCE1]